MEFIENPITVYVKINEKNEIIDVCSSVFIADIKDYIMIDVGYGDRYAHAQSSYFDKPIYNSNGYTYKYKNGKIMEN